MVEGRWGAGTRRADQIALGSGVAFVVFALVAFLVAGGPEAGATGEDIVAYYRDNDDAVRWQGLLFGLAAVFLLWFAGSLAAAVRRAEGDPAGRLPAIIVASVGATVPLYTAGVATGVAIGKMGDDATRALFDLGDSLFAISSFTAAAFTWAAALALLRTRLVAEWVGWIGAALTVLLLVNGCVQTLAETTDAKWLGTLTFVAFLAWVLVLSALLTWRPTDARALRDVVT